MNDDEKVRSLLTNTINGVKKAVKVSEFNFFNLFACNLMCISNLLFILLFASSDILVPKMYFSSDLFSRLLQISFTSHLLYQIIDFTFTLF